MVKQEELKRLHKAQVRKHTCEGCPQGVGGKSSRSQSVLGEMGQGKACLPSVRTRLWPF